MSENTRAHGNSLLAAITFIASVSIAVWLYTERTRFSLIPLGDKAYKYDRITGEIWLVVDSRYGPVDGPLNFVDQ